MDHRISNYYIEHSQAVWRYLYGLCRNADLAEDLTQETFFQAMKTIHLFRGECKPSVWLCQIGRHVWYKHLKNEKRYETVSIEEFEISVQDDIADQVIRTQQYNDVIHRISELEVDYKEVLILRLFNQLSFSEIAIVMGRTENWARVTFYRGKEKIRKGDKL